MKKLMLLAACSALLAGCGSTGTVNAELVNKKIPPNQARIVVTRDNSLLYFAGATNVILDGQKIASLARGATVLKDIPAGMHQISVHAPTTFGTYGIGFEALAGKTYAFEVSPNDGKSMAPGILFGQIGDAIDDTGYFKIQMKGRE